MIFNGPHILWLLVSRSVIRMTKIDCPICGISGFLQVRGTNVMVQHYQGLRNSKRMYSYHRVPYELFQNLQVRASKTMQVTTPDLNPISRLKWTGGCSHRSLCILDSNSEARKVAEVAQPHPKWRYLHLFLFLSHKIPSFSLSLTFCMSRWWYRRFVH